MVKKAKRGRPRKKDNVKGNGKLYTYIEGWVAGNIIIAAFIALFMILS